MRKFLRTDSFATSSFWRLIAVAIAAVTPTLVATSEAVAQEIATVKPYYVVPQTEDVKIRCHHGNLWYPITTVGTQATLYVDGEVDGWLRVAYPAGTPVVVKSNEAELSADRTTVKLTRKPRLRAFNKENQFLEECYKSVVIDDAPAPGIELRYLQSVKTRSGEIGGYLVEAPPGSKGFILATDVRRATPDEVQRGSAPPVSNPPPPPQTFELPKQPEAKPQPAEPAITAPVPAPVTQPTLAPVTTPAPETITHPEPAPAPTATPAPAPEPATIEMKSPPASDVQILVPTEQPAVPVNDTDPTAVEPAVPANAVVQPVAPRGVMTIDELDRTFDQLAAQPMQSAEYSSLIEEYQRYAATLPDDASTQRIRAYVDARVQVLQMKQQLQRNAAELNSLRTDVDRAAIDAANSAERIERTRDYLVVGRLQPSTVYDGKRLPLLYRVQAVEGGRTLAYVSPEPATLGLDSKLGMIVGVKGKGSLDPSARVNVITATGVDVLQFKPDGSYVPVSSSYAAPTSGSAYPTPVNSLPPSNFTPPAPTSTSPAVIHNPSGPMLPPRRAAPDYGGK